MRYRDHIPVTKMVAYSPIVGSEPRESNPLLPAIMATVLICGILTSVMTGLRLMTQRLTSSYYFDDCESHVSL